MSTLVSRPAADRRLWERFQAGRCSEEEIAGSVLLQRWLRCREAGLSADRPGEPVLVSAGLAQRIDSFAPLLAAGAPFEAFASVMANAGFSGLFCDAHGVILARRIAEPFDTAATRARLVPGALWSEAARGTNGMGTTLTEQAPVAVVGVEHYELRNHGLACYASPIRDIRERVVAVLDATGPVASEARFVHASVVAAAAALEALIVARTYDAAIPGGLFELERLLARLPHAALVIESTGRVRRANGRFRALAGPVPPERLAAPRTSGQPLEPPLHRYVAESEPIGDPGDPFATLVHLRPRRRRMARPMPAADALPEAFAGIVGRDPVMAAALGQAARFARTDLPVLLLAETGAGKEVVARALHAASTRARGAFVAVNCGALAGTLLESELFGYGPGAFTGAAPEGRTGKLAAAHDGTLFLDEVAEMSLAAQAMLLRFLEDGTFYRVGEALERRADVRLVAATSRELPALVGDGRFRSDLYFRLRGVVLRLPALRDRSDRRDLTLTLLGRIAAARALPKPLGASPAALEWIDRHDWPGNVRELRTTLEVAVVLAGDAPRIERWHLPSDEPPGRPGRRDLRAQAERSALVEAIEQARGNLSVAARSLGVARSTLYRMLARHDLRADLESLV